MIWHLHHSVANVRIKLELCELCFRLEALCLDERLVLLWQFIGLIALQEGTKLELSFLGS